MGRAYVFINDQMQGDSTIKSRLGANKKFNTLNIHIRNRIVMPGELIIVPDDSSQSCTLEEAELMRVARHVSHQVSHNSLGADGSAVKNHDVLQRMLNYGALGIGAVSGSWSKHLSGIEKTLDDIQKLHKLSLTRGTPIARQEFINQRQVLFAKLDDQLKGVARWGSGLDNRGSIKKMLGISTKSYLHTGEIGNYARRMEGVAKAAKLLKHGTAVGVGLNILSSGLEVKEACSIGREDKCEKAMYVEGGKLALGVLGGLKVGGLTASGAVSVCVAVFAIPTAGWGALGCGIIGGIAGGYAGGSMGEAFGEATGEMLYEWKPAQ